MVIMAYMWASCSFTYYMIAIYVKYIPGSIYTNSIASGTSEIAAYILAGMIYGKLGVRYTFQSFYALSVVGGACILFLGEKLAESSWMPFFVILAKFGVSGGFNLVYVCSVDVFPTLF